MALFTVMSSDLSCRLVMYLKGMCATSDQLLGDRAHRSPPFRVLPHLARQLTAQVVSKPFLRSPGLTMAGFHPSTPGLFKEHSTLLAMLGVEALQTSQAASRKAQHTRWRISRWSFGHSILHVQEEVRRAARPAELKPTGGVAARTDSC